MFIQIAKWMVALVALYGFGGLIADAVVPATSRQHLWNPAWPPHAKFHNGQTMLMGIFAGSLSLYILFACGPLTLRMFLLATAAAAMYWVSAALAPLFPGTAWYDPEFKETSRRPFGLSPQQILTYGLCGVLAVAISLVLI
ncbi:MAG: hypothetical protein JOZ31_20625 [Verrucomicrobia bacterium]|nr:hypothetical protein [Verrucomicrobiota bacterium]MBV8481929.1 hypothetical protein [Verrucomicrobiota bacterium]